MKKDLIQLVIAFFTLALGGALEDLTPKMMGVGIPVLLSATVYFALNRPPLSGMLFAVAAGAAEDALADLPFVLSVSFFTAVAGLLRGFKLSAAVAAPAFCCFQVWLWIWLGDSLNGNIFSRLFASFPLGVATLAAVYGLLRWLDRKAAVHDQ